MAASLLTATALCLLLYGRVPGPALAALLAAGAGLGAVRALTHRHRHGSVPGIDRWAHRSALRDRHPGLKLCLCVASALLCVAAEPLAVAGFVFLGMSALTVAAGRTPVGVYLSLLALPAAFLALGSLAIAVEITHTPLGLLDLRVPGGYLSLSAAGQLAALGTSARAMGAVSCLYMLSLSTPMHRLVDALRRMRLPGVMVELMYLIYRYLFLLLETYSGMEAAAESRLGFWGFSATLRTALYTARGLFLFSFRRASDSFAAMEARCYDGEIRFLAPAAELRAGEVAGAALFLAAAGAVWLISGGIP